MATLKVIRKRIASVRNTQKITKAMKMVAAAKLRRAQMRLVQSRAYASRMEALLSSMTDLIEGSPHPLFEPRETIRKAEFLILTSDRGLCGGFNGNLLRRVEKFIAEKKSSVQEIQIHVVGRKGRDYLKAKKIEPFQTVSGIFDAMPFEQALQMANEVIAHYQEGKFDEYYLVYNYFRSAISQEVRIDRILPLSRPSEQKDKKTSDHFVPEYIYEPSRTEVLTKLLPRSLATILRRAFLESVAGEFGARMAAMDNATNNCADMIGKLTLQMNRVRQAAITKELMDIVNGAESLKK